MRKTILIILIAFILLSLTARANAWDGKRRGFSLGFGIGPGVASYTLGIENTCYGSW